MIGGDEADEVQRLDVARLARQQLLAARERPLPVAAPIVDGGARQDQARVAVRVAVLAQRLVQAARRARGVAALLVDLAERDRQLDAAVFPCAGVSACETTAAASSSARSASSSLPCSRRSSAARRRASKKLGSRLSTLR